MFIMNESVYGDLYLSKWSCCDRLLLQHCQTSTPRTLSSPLTIFSLEIWVSWAGLALWGRLYLCLFFTSAPQRHLQLFLGRPPSPLLITHIFIWRQGGVHLSLGAKMSPIPVSSSALPNETSWHSFPDLVSRYRKWTCLCFSPSTLSYTPQKFLIV